MPPSPRPTPSADGQAARPDGPDGSGGPPPFDAPPSLVELAHRSLRESIVSGRFEMGERLNETRLAESLRVSRGPVREALRRLSGEGLVTERPRQGMFVRQFTAQDVADVYNLRTGIETVAARLAVRHRADLQPLQAIVDRMQAAAEADDLAALTEAEFAFHEKLCALSGNPHLVDAYHMLSGRIRMAFSLDNRANEQLTDLPARHRPLLEELRSGDERRAAAAIHRHITGHVGEVVERLGADPGELLQPLA